MITLYESILSDMEDIIDKGDEISDNIIINDENSNLRNIFSIRPPGTMGAIINPLSITGKNNDKTLTIKSGARKPFTGNIYGNGKYGSISDTISGVSTLCINDTSTIYASKDINKVLCNTIISDSIVLDGYTYLDDTNINNINLLAKQLENKNEKISTIINSRIALDNISSLTNSQLEVENKRITFYNTLTISHKIPTFKNVKSNSIQNIYISTNDKSNKIGLNLSIFNNLFETGYKLDCEYNEDKYTSFKVKDIMSLKKMLNCTKRTYKFSEYPYRLSKSNKLTDIFYVSKFYKLQKITINDFKNKIGMIFINTNSSYYNSDKCKQEIEAFKYAALHLEFVQSYPTIDKFIADAPTTVDGWKVIIYKP